MLLEGKPDKSLEIYAYGLKVLPGKHPRRELIEQLRKKLEGRMLLNRKDPFTILPLEIAGMVIQHFSFKQIVGILRVCKDWERFFGAMTHLWMSIDLSGARGKVPWTAIRSYIRRSKAMVTRAIIKNLATASTPKIMEFLSRCPRLEHLELWVDYGYKEFFEKFKGCKQLKSITLSPDIPIPHEYFGRLLVELPRLERIALWNVKPSTYGFTNSEWRPLVLPNMKSITLGTRQLASPSQVPALLLPGLGEIRFPGEPDAYPNLEELRLDWDPPRYQYETLPAIRATLFPLRRLDLRGLSVAGDFFAILPDSLEYLYVQGGSSARMRMDPAIHPLARLHTVILRDIGWATIDTLRLILSARAPIRTLHLDQCFNFDALDLLIAVQDFNADSDIGKLSELSISNMRGATDAEVQAIAKHLLDLKVLNLSYTDVTGCTIRTLADARNLDTGECARLDCLIVRGCEGVSSDAVAYGREQGLEVVV